MGKNRLSSLLSIPVEISCLLSLEYKPLLHIVVRTCERVSCCHSYRRILVYLLAVQSSGILGYHCMARHTRQHHYHNIHHPSAYQCIKDQRECRTTTGQQVVCMCPTNDVQYVMVEGVIGMWQVRFLWFAGMLSNTHTFVHTSIICSVVD